MPDVIVLNVHGGFPSAMVSRSLRELPGFAALDAISEVHERVYPTNACAGPALHDTIMDAPMGTMTDSVWHEWARTRSTSRSLFHIFQQNGYKTRLFGAFGLDPRLDPHAHMHVDPKLLARALETYGIDECDGQDAAFTCQLGFAYDREVLARVEDYMRDPNRPRNTMTMINLLGCQDAHKCTFHDVDPSRVSIPVMHFERDHRVYDERLFSENVVQDDPRQTDAASRGIDALRRSAQLKDWIRGVNSTDLRREELVRTVTGLHRFCWKCIEHIDEGLQRLIGALRETDRFDDAVIYVYSDHAVSLYEHGELCEAPWESCIRSFLIRRAPTVQPRRLRAPLSLADITTMLLRDVDIHADWHVTPATDGCCVTLGLALSWLARASMIPMTNAFDLRTFFVRATLVHNDREYSVILWFSLRDMAKATKLNETDNLDDMARARLYQQTTRWTNPVFEVPLHQLAALDAVQVYDHSTDPSELCNLAGHDDWTRTECARRLKMRVDSSIRHHRLDTFDLTVPENIHLLTADRVTFCSVQLHHRIRDRIRGNGKAATRNASTQTETDDMSFAQALRRTFGNELGDLLAGQVRGVEGADITVFAPEDAVGMSTWPNWAPLPLRGAYTRDGLLQTVERRLAVHDITGKSCTPREDASPETIQIGDARVSLRTAVHIVHAGGVAIGYRVYRATHSEPIVEDDDTPEEITPLLTPTPTPPSSVIEDDGASSTEVRLEERVRRPTSRSSRYSLQNTSRARIQHAPSKEATSTRGSARAIEMSQHMRQR